MNISLRKTVLFTLFATVLGACVPVSVVAADEDSKDKASEELKLEMQTKINQLLDEVQNELELLNKLEYLDVEARDSFRKHFEFYRKEIEWLNRSLSNGRLEYVSVEEVEKEFECYSNWLKDLIEKRKASKFLSWAWNKRKSKLLTCGLALGLAGSVIFPPVVAVKLLLKCFDYCLSKNFLRKTRMTVDEWGFMLVIFGIGCIGKSYADLRECFTGEETHGFLEGFWN